MGVNDGWEERMTNTERMYGNMKGKNALTALWENGVSLEAENFKLEIPCIIWGKIFKRDGE